MPLTYYNGGQANNYPGLEYNDIDSLMIGIRDNFTGVGWTIPTGGDEILTSQSLKVLSETELIYLNIKSDGTNIYIEGDSDGSDSFNSSLFSFGKPKDSDVNRLWMTVDSNWVGLSVWNNLEDIQEGAFYGYPQNRVEPTSDQGSYYIGQIHSLAAIYAEVAEAAYDGTKWQSWKNSTDLGTTDPRISGNYSAVLSGTTDRFTTAEPYQADNDNTTAKNYGLYRVCL